MKKTAQEIAAMIGGEVVGDGSVEICGVNSIKEAQAGEITFLGNPKYTQYLETTQASAVIVAQGVEMEGKTLIRVPAPPLAFAMVLQAYAQDRYCHPQGIHPTAVVGEGTVLGENVALGAHAVIGDHCRIGDNAIIYPGCYIGGHTTIGDGSLLYANVVVREYVTVGKRCIFQPGVVIGGDGFGFAPMDGKWFKIPQVGEIRIGDDVEIGANSAVDRATFGCTVINRGTKIDNLVQIGHNVVIGDDCVISGLTGVSGSATIGNHCTIAAQVGIVGHIEIAENTTVGARSSVTKSTEPGSIVFGSPAVDHNLEKRIMVARQRLPELLRRMRETEKRLQELEDKLHG